MADKKTELQDEQLGEVAGGFGSGGSMDGSEYSIENEDGTLSGYMDLSGYSLDGKKTATPTKPADKPGSAGISNRIDGTGNKSLQQGGTNTIGNNSRNSL